MTDAKIVKQVEFYFCDSNIVRDKFLKEQISTNEGGYVELATLATFKRLKDLSEDINVITAALKAHESKIYELSEDGTKIKRIHAIPEAYDDSERSIICFGFPLDYELSNLQEFFEDKGTVKAIRMFRTKDGDETRGCSVEFETKEDAEKNLKQEEPMKCGELEIKVRPKLSREQMQAKRKAKTEPKVEEEVFDNLPSKDEFMKGSVVFLCNIVDHPIAIKQALATIEYKPVFVTKSEQGEHVGSYVRFSSPIAAEVVAAIKEKEVKLKEKLMEARVVEGEEEDKYLEEAYQSKVNIVKNQSRNKGQGNQNRGKKNHKNFKRNRNDEREAKEAKQAKHEDVEL